MKFLAYLLFVAIVFAVGLAMSVLTGLMLFWGSDSWLSVAYVLGLPVLAVAGVTYRWRK